MTEQIVEKGSSRQGAEGAIICAHREMIALSSLQILCSIFDPNRGGPVIRARAVYQRMVAAGHVARIVLPDVDGTAADYVAAGGIPVDKIAIQKPVLPDKPLSFAKYLLKLPGSIIRMRAYLKQQKPDLLHANGAFDVVPAIAAKLAGIPLVWHLNDTIFPKGISRVLGYLVRALATEIAVAATCVGTHYGIPEARRRLLPAPVDVSLFPARNSSYEPGSHPRIGLVGNWNWVKSQDRFVDLIEDLHERGIGARGIVIGAFISRQAKFWKPIIKRIEDSDLKTEIQTPGFSSDVAKDLTRLDLLALTSRSEASPMCVLEAMAVGVPVVAFDAGGVRELLGEGDMAAGVVVAQGDRKHLADAAALLLSDPEVYRRMATNGRRRARDLFSLEACVARHEKIYRDAIKAEV